jgi:hypothetical protein
MPNIGSGFPKALHLKAIWFSVVKVAKHAEQGLSL